MRDVVARQPGFSEILYISTLLQVSCVGHYFDRSKLIFMLLNAENGAIECKGGCPFKIKNKISGAKKQTNIYCLILLKTPVTSRRTVP